ncbi:hypothetical protein ACFYW6_03360 [Streptomyces sp. NPDC002659]|uniref:hypothetical protein n=1 Tax=Streptomyces sp. NPDC002659 TaxID=3364656 RepID=UPI0036853148
MAEQITGRDPPVDQAIEKAMDAVAREAWADAYAALRELDHDRMGPDDLAALADAAWWTSRVEESIAARTEAYSGYVAAGAARRAGFSAWMLFYEFQLAGRTAAAAGWLRRARQHLSGEPECVEQCYLAWVEAEDAQRRGAFDEAMSCARRMAGVARRCGSPDLLAMSTQAQASVLLAEGRIAGGLALLDDAMCSAMAGELSSFFPGGSTAWGSSSAWPPPTWNAPPSGPTRPWPGVRRCPRRTTSGVCAGCTGSRCSNCPVNGPGHRPRPP